MEARGGKARLRTLTVVCNPAHGRLGFLKNGKPSTRARGAALQTHPPKDTIGYFMTEVKTGDTVRIHYTGTLADGETFDSSEGRDPLEFTVGSGQIIPGLEEAIPGMTVGDKKKVEIPADQAYGPVDPNAMQPVPRKDIPDNIPLDLGTQLQVQTPQGQTLQVTVAEVGEEQVVLDANHPLAGKDLTFDIELVEIA
jgi:peptidylprolyl isomerase